ncbi:glycogen synthase GlgA [Nitrosomonas oligotropha]|uniref:Glycogen synthase n=1 Tax=Nitrosomonas oligotropha TaxID=42354 RepID=A0A1H8PTH6_9PROT|nr:glycogen synthase GlgA [Nitrosomonas oligotropha]SDW64913.1 starch synthase [Nitrosomonas oligotropha]SEO44984.1 starch synthase [Nitrosomonas oligotropha]
MPSPQELRVLFITPEVFPLCKTGGLGDVSAALPAALRALHTDVRLLLPGYPQVLAGVKYKSKVAEFTALPQFPPATLLSARLSLSKAEHIPVFVIDCPGLYNRDGGPYMDEFGRDWPDNALRFGLLSRIGAILASDASPIAWRPHIAHCNDWQSGLTPAYLHFHPGKKAATLMTIHNLAFQGVFPPGSVVQLGLPPHSFAINGVEYYGNLSFLKAGLFYANHITTVSPNYAEEIQAQTLGFGLQGLLAARRSHLTGIVNGIDVNEWDPAADRHLVKNYSSKKLADKALNKSALQQQMELTVNAEIPLFGVISRLSHQKGIDVLIEIAPQLVKIPAQLIVLGSDQAQLEHQLSMLAQAHPGTIAVRIGFNEALSHLIEAGADCFLMPSRFEPCGLNQMYSQRYGTPPVVHATGGLLDTVVDCTPQTLANGSASGFVFDTMSAEHLLATIKRAAAAYHDKKIWHRLQKNGMAKDFSWHTSATAYREIYLSLLS